MTAHLEVDRAATGQILADAEGVSWHAPGPGRQVPAGLPATWRQGRTYVPVDNETFCTKTPCTLGSTPRQRALSHQHSPVPCLALPDVVERPVGFRHRKSLDHRLD